MAHASGIREPLGVNRCTGCGQRASTLPGHSWAQKDPRLRRRTRDNGTLGRTSVAAAGLGTQRGHYPRAAPAPRRTGRREVPRAPDLQRGGHSEGINRGAGRLGRRVSGASGGGGGSRSLVEEGTGVARLGPAGSQLCPAPSRRPSALPRRGSPRSRRGCAGRTRDCSEHERETSTGPAGKQPASVPPCLGRRSAGSQTSDAWGGAGPGAERSARAARCSVPGVGAGRGPDSSPAHPGRCGGGARRAGAPVTGRGGAGRTPATR